MRFARIRTFCCSEIFILIYQNCSHVALHISEEIVSLDPTSAQHCRVFFLTMLGKREGSQELPPDDGWLIDIDQHQFDRSAQCNENL